MSGVSNNELNNRIYKSLKKMDGDFYFGNIDVVHQRTHLGKYYTVEYLFTSVANDGYATMVIEPKNNTSAHLEMFYSTSGKCYLTTYIDADISGGTEVVPFNRNMYSLNVANSKVYAQPTITDVGTLRSNMLIGSGNNPSSQVGGGGGGRHETVVAYDRNLMLRIQNKSGTAGDISISFSFYEV